MNLSLGEFQALVAKAFRGGGYSWGLTEEAAFAARRIAEAGAPAGDIIVRLLDKIDGVPLQERMPDSTWRSSGSGLCPVCVGVSIADEAGCSQLEIGPTFEPLLIAPFLASSLRAGRATTEQEPDTGRGYLVEWSNRSCSIAPNGSLLEISPSVTMSPLDGPVDVLISRPTRMETAPARPERVLRVVLDEAVFEQLRAFAHRTYAPATEASRLAGAGGADDD